MTHPDFQDQVSSRHTKEFKDVRGCDPKMHRADGAECPTKRSKEKTPLYHHIRNPAEVLHEVVAVG